MKFTCIGSVLIDLPIEAHILRICLQLLKYKLDAMLSYTTWLTCDPCSFKINIMWTWSWCDVGRKALDCKLKRPCPPGHSLLSILERFVRGSLYYHTLIMWLQEWIEIPQKSQFIIFVYSSGILVSFLVRHIIILRGRLLRESHPAITLYTTRCSDYIIHNPCWPSSCHYCS